jgi:hypothetical protein
MNRTDAAGTISHFSERENKMVRIVETGEEKVDSFFVLRTLVVFNAEQTFGLKEFRAGFAHLKRGHLANGTSTPTPDRSDGWSRPTF